MVSNSARRLFVACILMVLLVLGFGIARLWLGSHPSITFLTDSPPVRVQIGSKSLVLKSHKQSLRLSRGAYNYSATSGSSNSAITLYGTVDTSSGDVTTVVNYRVFSSSRIKQALCTAAAVSGSSCGDGFNPISTSYVNDHSWAIVKTTPPGLGGTGITVLQIVNGEWDVVAGPYPDKTSFQGLIPQTVQEDL